VAGLSIKYFHSQLKRLDDDIVNACLSANLRDLEAINIGRNSVRMPQECVLRGSCLSACRTSIFHIPLAIRC